MIKTEWLFVKEALQRTELKWGCGFSQVRAPVMFSDALCVT